MGKFAIELVGVDQLRKLLWDAGVDTGGMNDAQVRSECLRRFGRKITIDRDLIEEDYDE